LAGEVACANIQPIFSQYQLTIFGSAHVSWLLVQDCPPLGCAAGPRR
jgi:hypothetical protein